MHVVARGEALLSPGVTRTVIAEFARRPGSPHTTPERLVSLTAREREVLTSIAAGASNAEIAQALQMSPTDRQDARQPDHHQIGCPQNRTQLVVLTYETGLITPGADPHLPRG